MYFNACSNRDLERPDYHTKCCAKRSRGYGRSDQLIQTADGAFTIVAAILPVTAFKGLLRKPVKAVSIEDMNETIAAKGANAL